LYIFMKNIASRAAGRVAMTDIFISYARSTAGRANQVAEGLRALGYGVWRDDELPPHRAYAEVIEERLRDAKAVVVVWSAEATRSEWVQSEADRARAGHKLVQLSVDGAPLPMPFDRIQCADLSAWAGEAEAPGWQKVMASIAELVGDRAAAPQAATPARKLSICVLPFVNMSGDPEQEYFSDGISEDTITDLSKVSALFVVARNTAFTFKGRSVDVTQVARQLNVSHVLEGSVRKAGGRVRITAQLIDGATGGHVWAERYDRELTDIFALQDEISQAIVAALKLKLLPEEKKAIERRGTMIVEAYNLYLMARQYYLAAHQGDARRDEAVIRLCRRAVEIDAGYAQAWALMASAQRTLRVVHGREGDGGLAALERALALDPGLAEAHALKARLLSDDGRQDEAMAEIAVALQLDPQSFEVNNHAGNIAYRQLRLEDAVRYYEKAMALMESNFSVPMVLVSCYVALGDAESAKRAARVALALAEKAVAQDRSNGAAMACGVSALAVLGEAERTKDWMDRALLLDPGNLHMRYNFACALIAHLNDADAALEMLAPVLEQAPGDNLNAARADPDLIALRGNPRFQAMIAAAEARLAAG
jgi:adenylate cyclase